MNLKDLKTVYFIGIGGIGMSALARYFHKKGIKILGYDKTPTELTQTLMEQGMDIVFEDKPDHIPDHTDLVVYTPAVPSSHLQFQKVEQLNLPKMKRAAVLGLISRGEKNIAVAGTHGKTTTSTMTTWLLHKAGFDPSAFLGGISQNFGTNYIEGEGEWVVEEADEYDRSFLHLTPNLACILSTEADHLDIYQNDLEIKKTYITFAHGIKSGGTLLYNINSDLSFSSILTASDITTYSFGISKGDIQAYNVKDENGFTTFDIKGKLGDFSHFELQVPGLHNVENALVAWSFATILGADQEKIKEGLKTFKGAKRRFDYHFVKNDLVLVDDYAHHPTEVKAAISAAKMRYPNLPITVIFQPHLFSRTRDFVDGFAEALSLADSCFLLDIYPARELPIEGVTSEIILNKMTSTHKELVSLDNCVEAVKKNFKHGVLMTMGAGNVDSLLVKLMEILSNKSS